MPDVVFGNRSETIIRKTARKDGRIVNKVLLGTFLRVIEDHDPWLKVETRNAGTGGFVHRDDIRDTPALKIFFVDVGQGDGAIIEHPDGIMLIDGGPNKNLYKFARRRYRPLIQETGNIHIESLVVSHPDADHFAGLIHMLKDPDFTFGTIFHNGIIRYDDDDLPNGAEFDLGNLMTKTINGKRKKVLTSTFDDLDDANRLIGKGHLMFTFRKFWQAALEARENGRLNGAKRITSRMATLPGFGENAANRLRVEVYGPVPTSNSGRFQYVGFPETEDIMGDDPAISSSHTRNGHSLILKLLFGEHSFLFGGDLNIPAQLHLLEHYGSENPFECDVAKACHHGSSDFHVDFLKKVKPHANVISSGDNKSFDHPMADAVGGVARHTKGQFPLLFATELARAVSSTGIHYGLINSRSNGETLVMAQMKEQRKGKSDIWDSFEVPWKGRFHEVLREGH